MAKVFFLSFIFQFLKFFTTNYTLWWFLVKADSTESSTFAMK